MLIEPNKLTVDRRRFFASAMGVGGLFFTEKGLFAQTLTLTPSTTEGPYYPDKLPLDQDNDLLVINNAITPGIGTIAWLSGRVLDRTGNPVRNAIVEIWQADNYGSYIHSNGVQNGRRDGNFQGYGTFETASDGQYLFRTIKPGLYTGRVRHVHCKVTAPGGRSLTTQLFIAGEAPTTDNVLSSIRDATQQASVIRPWDVIAGSPIGALAVNWDIVLDYTPTDISAAAKPTLFAVGGISNGASFRRGAASGSWVTLSGAALADSTRTWQTADFTTPNRLPESLDGVSVRINGQAASVYYISPTQINVLAPDTTTDGNVQVTVTNSKGTSDASTLAFNRIMPAFFEFPGGYAAAVRTDGTLLAPANLISGVSTVPAKPGETIQLFGTGFGPTTPGLTAGTIVTEPLQTSTPVTVRIDSQDAVVTYAGLTSAGLYQINVTIPSNLANGDYPVTAEVGGVRTLEFARIAVAASASAALRAPATRRTRQERRDFFALVHRIRGQA
ncbi:MAG TPA: IPT/TIG domain-containing protein [Bryobacteraceae bacterium]|nr:IPT/TIG domain-containing protein [Bryobacteraceae bacterium]